MIKYAGTKRTKASSEFKISRKFRQLLSNIKKYLKFNKFEEVFVDEDSEKKNFMAINAFLDVIDMQIKVPEEQLDEKYFQEIIEEEEFVSLKKLTEFLHVDESYASSADPSQFINDLLRIFTGDLNELIKKFDPR